LCEQLQCLCHDNGSGNIAVGSTIIIGKYVIIIINIPQFVIDRYIYNKVYL